MAKIVRVTIGSQAETPEFLVGTTLPVLADPLVPTTSDNVGWDGNSSNGTITSGNPYTIPAGVTVSNMVFLVDVVFTNATSRAVNCLFLGGPVPSPPGTRPGLVIMNNGGYMERCTVYGTHTSVVYWRNGVRIYGGVLTARRCAFYRTCDHIRSSSTARLLVYGCLFDRHAYFDNDNDQASSSPNPFWTHNDAIQITTDSGLHEVIGCLVWSRCDVTGVTWSGGSPGNGTASNGSTPPPITSRPTVAQPIGMPATQLNAGYRTQWLEGVWSNGFMNNGTGIEYLFEDNWMEGTNDGSACIQMVNTGTELQCRRNHFGVGGYRTNPTRKFLVSHPTSGSTIDLGTGDDRNMYGDPDHPDLFQSCVDTVTLNGVSKPGGIVGEFCIQTSGGLRYTA